MQITITDNQDSTTSIVLDFADEGVELHCETSVKGDELAATVYLPFFERDMRQNFADRFPPTTPEPDGGIEI